MDTFKDKFGKPLNTDDYVITVYNDYNHLFIAQITGWTLGMVNLYFLETPTRRKRPDMREEPTSSKFIKISPEDVTAYLLSKP